MDITLLFHYFPQKDPNDLEKLIKNITALSKYCYSIFFGADLDNHYLLVYYGVLYLVSLSSTHGDCACVS